MRLSSSRLRPSLLLNASALLITITLFVAIAQAQTRLTDGQPNIQGTYTRTGVKGLEANPPLNPIDPGEKNPLSVSNREDGLGPYPRIFGQGGHALRGGQQRVERRLGTAFPEERKLPARPDDDATRPQFLIDMNP